MTVKQKRTYLEGFNQGYAEGFADGCKATSRADIAMMEDLLKRFESVLSYLDKLPKVKK